MAQKSILITGCSSGIGLDAARRLQQEGWRVFASCRAQYDCDLRIAEGFEAPRLDYDNSKMIETALKEVLDATGGTLDALFNNGAYALPGALEDLPRDGLKAMFETNLFGYHDLSKQVIPVMRAQGHGHIINCSSVLGLVGMKWRGAYVASKFALEGLSDVLRLEMADTGIKVVLIEPGPVTTRIRQNAIKPFERWIDWENSPRREQYEALRHRLYKEDPTLDWGELPPSAVTKKLLMALNTAQPKPRYYVTKPTYLMGLAKRILSSRALDWLTAKG